MAHDAGSPLMLAAKPPVESAGEAAAIALMRQGLLHRYSEASSGHAPAAELEQAFARSLGVPYCVGMNSCGSTLFAALHACDLRPGEPVLTSCFTLSPVPGAIVHAGGRPLLVDCTDDYTLDFDDLERKAANSSARILLVSHMRGHLCDMERLTEICSRRGLTLVEDCAHTMGATWNGRPSGTWGLMGCFSLQSYKHVNAGEGGLLVTADADCAARAILLSGSYMFFDTHLARPDLTVFERWRRVTPNCSLRLSNLAAAVALPQLGETLAHRIDAWNTRYAWVATALSGTPHVRLPRKDEKAFRVGSSLQFNFIGLTRADMTAVVAHAQQLGLPLKWFGAEQAKGYTSTWRDWCFGGPDVQLPTAERVIEGLCDLRIPLTLTEDEAARIGTIVRTSVRSVVGV